MMIDITALPAFLLAVLVIAASPGPAFALIIQRAGTRGFARTVPTVLGIEVGLFAWALAVGLGLAALVAASEVAFLALKVVGVLFLAYLGIKALRTGWKLRGQQGDLPLEPHTGLTGHAGAFAEALGVQLSNPKAAVFLFAFYPPFMSVDAPLASAVQLGLIQVLVETVLYLALALGVSRTAAWFRTARIRRRFEYISGGILLALAARLAFATR